MSRADLLWLFLAAPLAAQQYTHLSGLIRDPSESAVPGASVTVVNEQTGFRRQAISGSGGGYVVASLLPGYYKMTVRKEGFRTIIRFGVKLDVSLPARLDFLMSVGSMQETITVNAAPPVVNGQDASVGTLVERDHLQRLPLNGRGVLGLIELAPGAVATPATRGEAGQFTVNGQRPNVHYFTVDGASANSGVSGGGSPAQVTGGSLPGMTAFGGFQGLIPLEAVAEFRVHTSSVSPESGRLPGAQISLSSRSGSNELHGSLFEYFRNEKLDANDWFANRNGQGRAASRVNDFGASLGGPLRRNRTFFFLSYEGLRLRQPFAWRAPVPTARAREIAPAWTRPLLNLFPAATGPELAANLAEWTGRTSRPARLDAASLRLDQAVTSRLTVFARYNFAPSRNEFGAAQIGRLSLRSQSLTAGLDLRIRPAFILDTRLNASSASADTVWSPAGEPLPACYFESVAFQFLGRSGQCAYFVRFYLAGVGQAAAGREGANRQRQFHLLQNASITAGRHQIRAGGDYRRLAPVRSEALGSLNLVGEGIADLLAGRSVWAAVAAPQQARSVLRELSLYVQDSWRVTDRLTATYGMRWEISPAPLPASPLNYPDLAEGQIVPLDRAIWPLRYSYLAPRAGLAWRPARRETVVRAGFGLYYDTSLAVATDFVNGGPLNSFQYLSSRAAPFATLLTYGFMPDLRLPLVKHWNVAVEHSIRDRDVFSLTYAGAAGRSLLRREMGGPGSTELLLFAVATNHGSSRYHGLQFQYRRRLAGGFQSLLSYSWSHSLDDSSSDSALHWSGSGLERRRDWASSDFDVRHALSAALTMEVRRGPRAARGFELVGMFRARRGFPVNVLNAEHAMGISFANVLRPDRAGDLPLWVSDPGAPGGRRLNAAAFRPNAGFVQGSMGRNAITGFGMAQLDLALRREFRFREAAAVEFRVESFNALNQANFGDPVRFLVSPLFGESPSMLSTMLGTGSPGSGQTPMFQTGGARSLQLCLRLRF